MLLRWMPWKFLIGRAARAYGIIDPVQVLARLRGFSQPSEVQEPIELLRAGVVFQARGLVNARVIQYNLDWIWPYWVERQFGPDDPSFIPRSFSFGHVNLTQRSWTAVGRPDLPIYAIVDPRGLVTPLHDGWSLDCWLIDSDGRALLPSRQHDADQHVTLKPRLTVHTRTRQSGNALGTAAAIRMAGRTPLLRFNASGRAPRGGWLIISIRPYNPEGISFVETISYDRKQSTWHVNRKTLIALDQAPDRVSFFFFFQGDVFHDVLAGEDQQQSRINCALGLATSAAAFRLAPDESRTIELNVPLARELRRELPRWHFSRRTGAQHEGTGFTARLPDDQFQFLFDNAVHTIQMLSAGDIYPGPYTYKRFWFRDGCLMLHALICLGELQRARRLLDGFVQRQNHDGYFQSQEGEWDSNGQVLWIMSRYRQLTGKPLPSTWIRAMVKAARWILAKRTPRNSGEPHAGLLPAGFSAEHLGPNDFYFWDDFWSVAGLKAAAPLIAEGVSATLGNELSDAADRFEADVFACIETIDSKQRRGGIPASPYRRMDAGAIGSMVADYPLQLTPPGDQRVMATLDHLVKHHFVKGGFFQDMIHSGINAYLTLDLAQTLLRAGDHRFRELVQSVADLASPTGNWPEAVHPFSGGGCMGDGQHGWAAAEWVMMVRNMLVREENGRLVIGSGLLPRWLEGSGELHIQFGPTQTTYGGISVDLAREAGGDLKLRLDCRWHGHAAPLDVLIPGFQPRGQVDPAATISLTPNAN